jgi:hypothetical protein
MFLRYTDLGVGHLVALRKIVRDCFGLHPAAPGEAMDVDEGGEDHDNKQRIVVDFRKEDSEDEEDEMFEGEEESEDGLDDLEEEVDESHDLSF